ncbi:GerAB/ArcD/ProY family transporter [Paenibacillus sp. strain BS8-2]
MSLTQFTILTIHFTIGTTILFGATPVTAMAKQDGWIASALGVILNLITILLYNRIGRQAGSLTIPQYADKLLGKWGGRLTMLFFLSYVILLSAFLLRVVGGFMTTYIIPDTPIEVIHLLLVFVTIVAARMGIDNLARTSELFFPWVLLFIISMLLLLLPQLDINNMLPILEAKPNTLSVAAFYYFSLQEQVVLMFLLPYVSKTNKAGKAFLIGTLFGSVIICLMTLFSILVLGADMTGGMLYPSYILAKTINVGNFLQRIEAVMAILWLIAVFVKITVCFYVSCEIVANSIGMKNLKPLTFPLGMIILVLSISVYKSTSEFLEFTPKSWSVLAVVFTIAIPGFLAIMGYFRKNVGSQ